MSPGTSPLSVQETNVKRDSHKDRDKKGNNPQLNKLLFGRKRIVFLTRVLIATLEVTQNEFTPLLSFLLTKYMKKVIDCLKNQFSFTENSFDKKDKEVIKLIIVGLKEMDEKI